MKLHFSQERECISDSEYSDEDEPSDSATSVGGMWLEGVTGAMIPKDAVGVSEAVDTDDNAVTGTLGT